MQNNAWEWTTEATAIKSTRIAFPEYGVFRQLENDDDMSANLAVAGAHYDAIRDILLCIINTHL